MSSRDTPCSPELAALPLPELLQRLDAVPAALRTALRNSGGGYVNHELFWKVRSLPERSALLA